MDFKNEKALHYIDLALNLDKSHSNNWDIKAIVLEGMEDIRMIYPTVVYQMMCPYWKIS